MTKKLPEMLCRWNVFEPMVKDTLREYSDGTLSAENALQTIDTYLAAATCRGGVLSIPVNDAGDLERICWEKYEKKLQSTYPNDHRFSKC